MCNIKKFFATLLVLLLCFGMLSVPTFAAELSQDGLETTLITDKDEYAQDETVVATLTVKNTNPVAVYDVSLESMVPEGYVLADGDEAALQVDTLAAGETVTLTVRFVSEQSEEPTTGDNSFMYPWIALLVAVVSILMMLLSKLGLSNKLLSLLLSALMALSPSAGIPSQDSAAGNNTKKIDISTTVQVDDEPMDIRSFVQYTLTESGETDVHTVQFDLNYEGAPQVAAQQVPDGECAVQPEGITREGYDLAYWYIIVDDSVEIVDLSQPVTADMMLYARWIEQGSDTTVNFTTYYKVSFDYPASMTEEDILETYLPEEELVYEGALVYSLPTPIRDGYVLAAWYYDSAMTKLAAADDVINKDTVLYPMMLEENASVEGMPTTNYVADLDVDDLNHSVTVQASSLQAVKDGLVFLNISDGAVEMDFNVTDNGDGTYTVQAADELEGGKTYQLRLMDRDQIPSTPVLVGVTEDYIRFFHDGELQSTDVIYYNIFTIREEIVNMTLADDLILIPIGDVTGIDMETVSSLFTVTTDDNGEMNMETNELEGSFHYTGSKKPAVGDLVAIYEGGPEVEEEYLTSKTVASAKNTAFLEILSVDGDSYTYRTAKMFDVMYFPDMIPIPLLAETDGNPDDNTITVADSYLDFRYLPVESNILDENTTADPGDFVAFYNGTLENATDISYGKIVSVVREDGFTTIVFEDATYDDIQSALDSFVFCDVPIDIPEDEQVKLENEIVQQGTDSGFAEKAAAVAVREKLAMTETPIWGERYTITREQAQTLGVDVDAGELDAGMLQFHMDPPDVNANFTSNLKRITTMNNGLGVRVAFGIYIPVSIEFVNVITNKVEQSFNMDLYLTLEQELALDVGASLDAGIDTVLGFIPTDAWVRLDVFADVGIYTGVGAVAIIDTAKNYEKQYIWDQLVKNDGSNGAFTSATSLSDQLNSMLSGGDATFFDMYQDEEGNSTLIQEYQRMLRNEVDYMDILAIPLTKIKTKIMPQVPVGELVFIPEIVFSAKLNVMLGTSFELMNVKRYSFSLYASIADGVRAWTNPVVDKQTPYHSLNILLLGNLGLRAGIRGSLSLGLLSVKLANVGLMLELGAYVDLYGFGYYHYDWRGKTATQPERTNIQSAGAIFVDVGIYADIDLYGGVLMDTFTFTFHVLELQVSLWTAGYRQYIYDVELWSNTFYKTEKELEPDAGWFTLDYKGQYRVKMFDIVSGNVSYYTLDRGRFTFLIPDEYKSKLEFSEFTPIGQVNHLFHFKPTTEDQTMTAKVELVLIDSIERTRASKLDSIYDLIGPASETLTLNWSREKYNLDIRYVSKEPDSPGSGAGGYYCGVRSSEFVSVATVKEDSKIPKLSSINNKAPQIAGWDFAGWEVDCRAGAPLDGKFIQDISELAGYTMPSYRIDLYPRYTPRNDTKYTVRHLLPSLTDPEKFEVFAEEVFEGTTSSRVNAIDYYIQNIPGIYIDGSRLPITMSFEYQGSMIYFFDYSIYNDGSQVIDLYYKRDSAPVTLYANNPDFADYGTIPASITRSISYGETITDPGYSQVQIPGYTFLGWSTTADGSSGIMKALPDTLDFASTQRHLGFRYYAIWKPENVDVKVNYYLLDPYGEYNYLGTETHEMVVGAKLLYRSLEPDQVSLYESAYGKKMEARVGSQAYTKDYVSVTEDTLVIDCYYAVRYSNVYIDGQQSYQVYDEEFVLPETATEKQGYLFNGWKSYYEGGKIYEGGQSIVLDQSSYYFIPMYVAADDTRYTVEHYKEQTNGSYLSKPDETQVLYGTTDSWVTPATNTYTGFDSPYAKTVQIAPDGSTVVKYYYSRKVFEVTVDFRIEGENVGLDGRYPSQYTYGVSFALSDYDYPLKAKREDYTFVGWYLADEELNPDCTLLEPNRYWVTGEALTSERDLVFKPMWEKTPYEYRVEHYLEQLDGSYALQQTDKPTGYRNDLVTAQAVQFNGFTYDATNSNNVLSGTVTNDGSLVLKLYYNRNSYDALWYDYDGTSLLATTRFKFGQTITTPNISANREGYIFSGWNIGSPVMTTSGASYNAKDNGSWSANTYTVVFDANGGEGIMSNQSFTYDKMQSLTANSFKKYGCTFAGWSLSADGEVKYADQAQVANLASSGTVALFAQWETGAPATYKVVYYGEKLDGTGFEEIKTENYEGITNSDASVTPINIDGFTYDASNVNNVTYGTIVSDGSLVLKLYYTRNSYTLTLDFNGESMKQVVRDYNTGENLITGFYVEDQTVTLKYGQSLSDALVGITVPVMSENDRYIWDDELGEYVEADPVPFETAFPGYEFGTWDGICDTMPAEDLTLTAQWTPITITVTFYSGYSMGYAPDVTGTTITKTYSYGDSISFPENDFEWSNHTIIGWKLGDGSGGFGQYPEIVDTTIELVYGYLYAFYEGNTLELFPYWASDDYLITVEFNGNGAESGTMNTFLVDGRNGTSLIKNMFSREGYTFVGWNTAADGSGKSYEDRAWISTYYVNTSEIMLYAQWEKNE